MGEDRRRSAKERESSEEDSSADELSRRRESRRSDKAKGGDRKRRDSRRSDRDRSPELRHRDSRRSEKETSPADDIKHRDTRRRDRDREKRKDRDKHHRDRDRSREKEKEKEKSRDRERRRDRERGREKDGEDRKRRRKEEAEESVEDGRLRRRSEEEEPPAAAASAKEKEKTREEDLEEEQRKLDDEMEKRRRRVQEWQELRRKKEEQEREKNGEIDGDQRAESGKKWTLEGDSDEDELSPSSHPNPEDESKPEIQKEEEEEEEEDPLDAFMNTLQIPVDEEKPVDQSKSSGLKPRKNAMGRIIQGEDNSGSEEEEAAEGGEAADDEDDDEFMKRVKKTKVEKLSLVDHSKIQYPPFRKNFYIEVKEISRMPMADVAAYRKEHELKIHGKDVPKPVKTWNQTGLTSKILETIKKLNFDKPMPIQAQALPVIMSGRDCIGIAKTGSGKTLAFVLPMLRHIKDQPPVVSGDGPVGLIMAPTRELVQQIHSDIKKFAKAVGLVAVAVYGGSGVAQQISDLKRGAEIVVCTPGRMIDILCTSSGKITNLRRVTYMVMDEADRMFDMGFEPQITRIIQNTRPDRQTVLFSATFPRQVEILARRVLSKPVEIQVGGRSVVNKDISQLIEVREEKERFLRLLELLGEWYEKGKILVFVHSQDKCDSLFKDLLRHGYPCLSLHGAKDQTDRESTITDFKSNVCNLLVATSIAARGLDVKELELVVNFDVPNHYEDYVHRVGRTGRAGRKGCAVTFISEEEERYAPDLVKALELSEQAVPQDLKKLAEGFMVKVNQGTEQAHGTGYGGSGFKFNEEEDEARRAAKKAQAREYGFEEDKSESDSDDDVVQKAGGDLAQAAARAAALAAPLPALAPAGDAAARAAALAAALNLQHNLAKIQADALPEHYVAEFEINDFPQNARWKVTHKETLGPISEWTGAAITTRGQFYPPGKIPPQGERKLYLYIEGPTESSVKKAKVEIKRVLEDCTAQALSLPSGAQPGKYSVI
ncbi:DEAD-box ATP-dependent RNA helicase 45-like [Wolffia australiana]